MNQPPLIAHIIYALGTGGLENGLVNIINRTPPDRYRHAIICLTRADSFASRITAPGVEVVELHKRPGQDLSVYIRLWRVLRRLSPAVVHTRNLASLEMQVVTLALPGTRRVQGEHGRDIQDLDGSNRKYNLLRKAIKPLIHRYIAVSEDLRQWLHDTIHVPEQHLVQIYNGVDSQKFTPVKMRKTLGLPASFQAEDVVVIGTVGRLAEVKNQSMLVNAVATLLSRKPDLRDRLRLLLVGGGPLSDTLAAQVEGLGLDDMVCMTGDREDIPCLLQSMDIFVLPSLAEGISNTLLEAMATGLPVVATRVGGNPELIEEGVNGYLVPVNDHRAMADALGELVEHRETRERMGEAGLERVRRTFNWDRTVARYLGVYDDLLGIQTRKATDNNVLGN
ncbi:MAG: TIGR03088 family PEP-CTERM/XrtA system glycosyltransferase [Porticoccaceae bacterium]